MKISLNGQEFDMNGENTAILKYPNELMDGIYFDIDEEQYAFSSRWSESFEQLLQLAICEGIEVYNLEDCEINLDEPPHLYIVSSLGKLTVKCAEWCLEQ